MVHLRDSGFTVETRNVPDQAALAALRATLGVPPSVAGCHTATAGGYVIEGHVPADVIDDLLALRPDVVGIAVPGMPHGSPGMESANPEPYAVVAFDRAGRISLFARR